MKGYAIGLLAILGLILITNVVWITLTILRMSN